MTCLRETYKDEIGEWEITITTPNGGMVGRVIPAMRAPGFGAGTYAVLKQEAGELALLAVVDHAQREAQNVPLPPVVPLCPCTCSSTKKELK